MLLMSGELMGKTSVRQIWTCEEVKVNKGFKCKVKIKVF